MILGDVTVVTAAIPPRVQNGMLDECIRSVTAQTVRPTAHHVIVDYAARGESWCRNQGIAATDTEWIAWLDDDDLFRPQHLERLIQYQQDSGADLVYPWFDIARKNGQVWAGYPEVFPGREGQPFDPAVIRSGHQYIPVPYLLRTELAREVGFPERIDEGGDQPPMLGPDWLFLNKLLDAGAVFRHLPERTWLWRLHYKNTSGRRWTECA